MLKTIEAVIDQNGKLRFLEPVQLTKSRRVLITILDDAPTDEMISLALTSEPVLAKDWERPEEDAAWAHLDQLPSL